jgi:hypothetical protein
MFSKYDGAVVNRMFYLNNDGSRYIPGDIGGGFDNNPSSIAVQADGKIVVGGEFSLYEGASANNIVRLEANGARDTTFDVGSGFEYSDAYGNGASVTAVAVDNNNKIVVGGTFNSYNGTP